jgi:hypothetical protein
VRSTLFPNRGGKSFESIIIFIPSAIAAALCASVYSLLFVGWGIFLPVRFPFLNCSNVLAP